MPALLTGDQMLYLSVHGVGDVNGGNRNAYQHPGRISMFNETMGTEMKGRLVVTLNTPAYAGLRVRLPP